MKRFLLFFFSILFCCAETFAQYGWTQRASLPADARHRSVCVAIGNRIYLGLGHINSVVDVLYNDWWEYDPSTDSWTQKADYGGGLRHHGVGFVINNQAYVGTGRSPSATTTRDFWRYDPLTNFWVQVASMPVGEERRAAVGMTINGKGYVGTGQTPSGYTNDWWEYNASTNSWAPRANYMGGQRFAATGFVIGTKGYVGTGEDGSGNSTNNFFEYNPSTNSWAPKANVPGIARLAACGFAMGGMGYIGTGEDFQSGNNQGDFYKYNVSTNTWTQMQDFSGVARRYMIGAGLASRGYCGTGTSGTNMNDWWEFGNLSGEEELSDEIHVNIYPNPMVDYATVDVSDCGMRNSDLSFELYDLAGKRVLLATINGRKTTINRGSLKGGVYLYSISEQGKNSASGKLIVE